MPARSIANATISFGLVSVPVNLYSSAESKVSVSFNMLHKKCGTRLKQQYICPKENEVVTRDDTVKGYEFAKDQYVVLSTDELKAIEEKATGMIDVLEFVPLAQVDREYLEKVYYLGPDKGGDRAYRLLTEAGVPRREEAAASLLGRLTRHCPAPGARRCRSSRSPPRGKCRPRGPPAPIPGPSRRLGGHELDPR